MFTEADVQSIGDIWRGFVHHSRTFSLAARLLPGSVRMPVATLYIFCRSVDTIADERVLAVGRKQALQELDELNQKLDSTLSGEPPVSFFWQTFAEVDSKWPLNRKALYELIEGARWDLEGKEVDTPDDLMHYAGLVGGSVGAMMLPFLVENRDFNDLDSTARALGNAMQITNILRDVGQDLRELDRCYLPGQWMEKSGINRKTLENGTITQSYVELLEHLMKMAEDLFLEGFKGIRALPVKARFGIAAAARMYREILNEIRKNGYNNLDRRAYVSNTRKLSMLVMDNYKKRRSRTSRMVGF